MACEINYVSGDATAPKNRPTIIAHICNNGRIWGAGFVIAISKKWKAPEEVYRGINGLTLGDVQFVECELGIIVANMIAQVMVGPPPLVRYGPLATCLKKVGEEAIRTGSSISMPRIGCGIGGGSWSVVEKIILRECPSVPVYVYDLENS